jgi:hypothetical protein
LSGSVVVPDRGGQCEDALQDADDDSGRGAAAVSFQVELPFESLVDRLDRLAQWLEQSGSRPLGLACAGSAQQFDPARVQVGSNSLP